MNTVILINDKMKNNILIPNKSVGKYIIGEKIHAYLQLNHYYEHCIESFFEYDRYEFPDDDIIVYVEDEIIQSITCNKTCFWKGVNIIHMNFESFLKHYTVMYDSKDEVYLRVAERFQTQKVYDFDELGLQIWVWRNLIRTVIVSKYNH